MQNRCTQSGTQKYSNSQKIGCSKAPSTSLSLIVFWYLFRYLRFLASSVFWHIHHPRELTSNPQSGAGRLFQMWMWPFVSICSFCQLQLWVLIHPENLQPRGIAWSAVEAELVREAERTRHAWVLQRCRLFDGWSFRWPRFRVNHGKSM